MKYPFRFSLGYLIANMFMAVTLYIVLAPVVGIVQAVVISIIAAALIFWIVSRKYYPSAVNTGIISLTVFAFIVAASIGGIAFTVVRALWGETYQWIGALTVGWLFFWIFHMGIRNDPSADS